MALSWNFSTLLLGLLVTLVGLCYGQLEVGFYKGKCGENDIEKVIYNVVKQKIANDADVVSDLVRLSFHDCFIRGCDGSILLEGENTEQKAKLNQRRLGGINITDSIKEVVESTCPGVVSCTDVIVLATRAAIHLAGGIWYEVETGRRDGRVSLESEAEATLPPPTISIEDAIELFAEKGLNKEDFVVLLGGHTVGTAHCHSFKQRLTNFTNTNKSDSTMAPTMFDILQKTCSNSSADNETFLDQTPGSHFMIDNAYYKQILAHKGVLEIDQKLALNSTTRDLVKEFAYSSNNHFLNKFALAMVKLSKIEVLTGNQGEIRKQCGVVN